MKQLLDDNYLIRGIRKQQGTEGQGYTASLYRGARRVAALLEAANGAPLQVQWLDASNDARITADTMVAFNGIIQREQTLQEAELSAYLLEKYGTDPYEGAGADLEIWLDKLTQHTDLVNITKKALQKAVFYHPESFKTLTYKVPYDKIYKGPIDEQISQDYPEYKNLNTLPLEEATQIFHRAYFKHEEETQRYIMARQDKKAASPVSPS